MALDEGGSERHGGIGGLQAYLMPRVPDGGVELRLQRLDHAEVELLGVAWIAAGSMGDQQVIGIEHRDSTSDLLGGGHAGR
ncbi:hypothetical protein D3C87_1905260 [compost metagenome]